MKHVIDMEAVLVGYIILMSIERALTSPWWWLNVGLFSAGLGLHLASNWRDRPTL